MAKNAAVFMPLIILSLILTQYIHPSPSPPSIFTNDASTNDGIGKVETCPQDTALLLSSCPPPLLLLLPSLPGLTLRTKETRNDYEENGQPTDSFTRAVVSDSSSVHCE